MSDFEEQMLYHASPALLGRKQANLFSFAVGLLADYRKEIEAYRKELASLGISVEYLYYKNQRIYLLVYRKEMLLQYLNRPAVRAFLIHEGYPENVGEANALSLCMNVLRRRIYHSTDFPHEIGFFFGYPEKDVFSFIREKGENYKICGDWKVYGDEKSALRTFRSYQRCRKRLMEQAAAGIPILQLLHVGNHGSFSS